MISWLKQLLLLEEKRRQYLSEELLSGRLRVRKVGERFEVYKNPDDNWQTVEVNGRFVELPKDWGVGKIGEQISMTIGNTPPKTGKNYQGMLPWVTISDIDGRYVDSYTAKITPQKNTKILPKGTLVGSFKMSVGKFGFLAFEAATNEAIIAIKKEDTKESLEYLYFALPKVFTSNAVVNGQGLMLLNTKTIKALQYVKPDIVEQGLIAELLSIQDGLVGNLADLVSNEKRKQNTCLAPSRVLNHKE